MPQDLATLLVEEGAVSQADMERAVARQVQLGGALDTALLELELIGEGHLRSFLSHASGLPPVPPEALAEIDPRSRRVFPARVAERHRLAPFALDGRELSVVSVHPVDAAAVDEIGFMLSLTLVPHVGPEWRVHDLIHRLYGGQMPARLARLAESAGVATAPAAAEPREPALQAGMEEASPLPRADEVSFAGLGEPVGEADAGTGAGGAADETSFAEIEPERKAPSGFARDAAEPAEPLLAALELAVDAYDALWADAIPEPAAQLPPQSAPVVVDAEPPPPSTEEPPPAVAEQGTPVPAGHVEATEDEAAEPELPPARLDRSAPPHWSIDDASAALATAVHRDEVVLTALRYARDFFEFSALFAVTRDAVVGHDALGSQEDPRPHARGTAIYAEDPGIVKTVLETRAPYLGPASRDAPGTANILDGLWRGTPRTVLLYPILVGDRAVAVLYADNGEAPVSARRLGDLLLFLSRVGGSFERIIRARKKRRPRAVQAPAPPVEPVAEAPQQNEPSDPAPSWMAPPPEVPVPEAANEPALEQPAEPTPAPPPSPEGALDAPPAPGGEAAVDRAAVAEARLASALDLLLAGGPGTTDRVAPFIDLLLDPDPGVAETARDALARHRADPAVKPVPERLRRGLLSGIGERPVLAARALGALRDIESIPILIQAFEGGSPEGGKAAAAALSMITLQRFGPSAQKWLRWWKENRGRSRAEWLFAALTAPDRDLRVAAADELRAAADAPVHYTPDLPAAELEAAARAWWVWWSRQGVGL